MRYFYLLIFSCITLKLAAQPPVQNLAAIDPKLVNGFIMITIKLTGKEFKGPWPAGAAGASSMKMLIGLRKLETVKMDGSRSQYRFEVYPYFSFTSWLADTVKNDPKLLANTLSYEQNHYDLELLMAAELKKRLGETWFNNRNYAPGILALRDKLLAEQVAVNSRYEADTNQGRDKLAIAEWDELIKRGFETKSWSVLYSKIKPLE